MARKIATIGITINLENYENLRLEVQGEVGDDGNTEELVSFLDGMLARLGHGDQATAERVEAYRWRVLAAPGSVVVAAVPDWQVEAARTPAPRPAQARESPEPATRPPEPAPEEVKVRQEAPAPIDELQPATVRAGPEVKAAKLAARARSLPEPKPQAAPSPEPRRAPAPPAPQQPREAPKEAGKPQAGAEKPAIAEGEVACQGCGLSITKNQEKLSRLLTGKSLCKRCMNPP
jgi:outer membrane biosynthesis protein TonB